MGSGLEIAATIELEVAVLKNQILNEPWVLFDDVVYVSESGETMEIALAQCCQKMNRALQHLLHCNEAEAGILMGLSGNSKVCQVVNDKTTMRFGMPYSIWKGNRTQ